MTGVITPNKEAYWVLRAQCNDREALESLLLGALPLLQRYLLGLIGPLHADDVAQEVLITVSRKIRQLHTPELFRPWLYRIASRAAFRYLKRERRWRDSDRNDSVLESIPAPDRRPPAELMQLLLNNDNISPASRAVLALHFQEEWSLPEVAAILDIPLGTVKSRLAYGLNTLRKELNHKGVSDV